MALRILFLVAAICAGGCRTMGVRIPTPQSAGRLVTYRSATRHRVSKQNEDASRRAACGFEPMEFVAVACEANASPWDKPFRLPAIDVDAPLPYADEWSRGFEPDRTVWEQNDEILSENALGSFCQGTRRFCADVCSDFAHFYSADNVCTLTIVLAGAAVLANTGWDSGIRDPLQENLAYTPSDEYGEFFHNHKFLGDGAVLLPAYATIAMLGHGWCDEPLAPVIGEWGERSLRTILVGAPPMLALQLLTGGSRPEETHHGAHWRPLADDNGVSGHAFMGAVPLLTAANMAERPGVKIALYSASFLPGLSRITDGDHYPSQVMLGWTIAYVAATAVDQTECNGVLFPWISGDAAGIGFLLQR